jgi:mono/diheme cytochrome c family protein
MKTGAIAMGAAALVAIACTRPDPLVPRRLLPEEAVALREETRALAKPPCGSCHQDSLASAKPAALAVFDLDREDWTVRMSGAQLQEFLVRINGKLDESTRPRVRRFLEGELARR